MNIKVIKVHDGYELYDSRSQEIIGKTTGSRDEARAKQMASFYETHPRPFSMGDRAIVQEAAPVGLTTLEFVKVRLCEPDLAMPSGWKVTVTRNRVGRPPFSAQALCTIDSDLLYKTTRRY